MVFQTVFLSKLILYLDKNKLKKHLICANEGGAVGLAIGNYFYPQERFLVFTCKILVLEML